MDEADLYRLCLGTKDGRKAERAGRCGASYEAATRDRARGNIQMWHERSLLCGIAC
jgi:hypothetical protein